MKEIDLIEKKDAREKLISRIDVLDKVKKVNTLADTEYMTTNQVAEFYEVNQDIIRQLYKRNKDELLSDNATHLKYAEIKKLINRGQLRNTKISPNGSILYPKKAVLKIGMMLRDSEVASKVRVELLKNNPDLYRELNNGNIINCKKYEEDMYAYLVATFGKSNIKRQVEYKGYYIDFVLYDYIAIEVDENGHSGYIVLHEEKREELIKDYYKLFRYDTRDGIYLNFISDLVNYLQSVDISECVNIAKLSKAMNISLENANNHIERMRGEFLNNGMLINKDGEFMLNSRSVMLFQMTYSDNNTGKMVRDYMINNEYN